MWRTVPKSLETSQMTRRYSDPPDQSRANICADYKTQATFPTNLSASFVALFDVLGLQAPWQTGEPGLDHILIVGGGSNCGKLAVQLAKLARIQNIIVVGGNEPQLKRLGATQVIDRHLSEDAIVDEIRNTTSNDLSYALDAVNFPDGLNLALRALSDRRPGKVARLLPIGSVNDTNGHELLDVLGLFLYRNPLCIAFWKRLTDYVAAGSISPTSFSTLNGLDADVVNTALDGYRDGTSKHKPQIRI